MMLLQEIENATIVLVLGVRGVRVRLGVRVRVRVSLEFNLNPHPSGSMQTYNCK